jgi:hypothetical protein
MRVRSPLSVSETNSQVETGGTNSHQFRRALEFLDSEKRGPCQQEGTLFILCSKQKISHEMLPGPPSPRERRACGRTGIWKGTGP